MLACRNLGRLRRDRTIFSNVDLILNPGSSLVITGPSGSGKTTLLRCIALLEPFDEGEVMIESRVFTPSRVATRDPWIFQPNQAYPALTLVFQQFFLWPHLTMRRNITLPQDGRCVSGHHISFDDIIRALDLAPILDRHPNECSVGEKQRVALARALLCNTRYLLLDEITSGLNRELARRVVDILAALQENGTGLLVVTHDESAFARLRGELRRLEDGRLGLP